MSLITDVKDRVTAQVPALAGAIDEVADLSALIRENALPQRSPYCFVIPLGMDGGKPGAVAGLFRQEVSTVVSVVLYVEAPGDAAARSALPKVDTLRDAIIAALAGWAPPGSVAGVFELRRARLVSVNKGAIFYQIDFAIGDQLRITT